MSLKQIVYTDESSRGNPGPSALGVVIKNASGMNSRVGKQLLVVVD